MRSFKFLLTFLTLPLLIMAQSSGDFGIKAGYTSAWQDQYISEQKIENIDSRSGIYFGGYLDLFKGDVLGVKIDLGFTQKGFALEIPITTEEFPDGTGSFTSQKSRLNYLTISFSPNVFYKAGNNTYYGFAGARVDIELSKDHEIEGPGDILANYQASVDKIYSDYKSVLFGLTSGAGVQIGNVLPFDFGIEFRYNSDLSNVYENDFVYYRNSSLDILVFVVL